jgi:phosphoribosyl 1,2-cyclic phosphodiesterase
VLPFVHTATRESGVTATHDAPNVALRLSSRDRSVAYATDLGHAPAGLAAFLAASDAVLLEANHCHEALAVGPYTERLRRRISSNVGHLSNVEAGLLVRDVRALGDPLVALCHLSQVNNSPELALRDVGRLAPLARLTVLPHGEPVVVDVERARTRAAVQLALGLG